MFFTAVNFVYNYYLDKRKKELNLSFYDTKKDLNILKKNNNWLNDIDINILYNAIYDLNNAFMKYKKNQNFELKPKLDNRHKSYRTFYFENFINGKIYPNILVDLKKGIIKLPKLDEVQIRGYKKSRKFNFKILSATVKKNAGKYYVSITVIDEIEVGNFIPNKVIGVDLGIKNLVTTSDGIKYSKILGIKSLEKRLCGLKKALYKSEKGSKNREKIAIKIEKVYQKIHNKRKFYLHSITNELIAQNDIIITENLKVKEMIITGKSKLAKYLINSSLTEIIRQLEYKAKWNNKRLYKINSYYPSSQICSNCKFRNKDLKDLNIRSWKCPNCHVYHDRDINASLNILSEGKRIFFKNKNY